MHFAGSIVVPESVENPLKYYENNTVKSRSLIESAVGGRAHFIFSSTAATYGIPERVPVGRDDRRPSRSIPMAGRS
jgi:UDP-glucose 4-epimerase